MITLRIGDPMANGDVTRNFYLDLITKALAAYGEQVLDIASNAICFPCVKEDGDEAFIKVVVSIPKGAKDEPFDGFAQAEDWKFRKAEKAEKAKAREAEKARKIERDRKAREVKAKIAESLK